ncbi:MAG: GIY-YIG nuclease family protein [Methanococcaceae archaeon]
MIDKNEIKKNYKETARPLGIYRITNKANGKMFIGSSMNIPARINRHKMELRFNSDNIKELQKDYQQFGEENFVYDVVDLLEPKSDGEPDYKKELELLEEMWLEKLQPYDDKGYNLRGQKHYFKK